MQFKLKVNSDQNSNRDSAVGKILGFFIFKIMYFGYYHIFTYQEEFCQTSAAHNDWSLSRILNMRGSI